MANCIIKNVLMCISFGNICFACYPSLTSTAALFHPHLLQVSHEFNVDFIHTNNKQINIKILLGEQKKSVNDMSSEFMRDALLSKN